MPTASSSPAFHDLLQCLTLKHFAKFERTLKKEVFSLEELSTALLSLPDIHFSHFRTLEHLATLLLEKGANLEEKTVLDNDVATLSIWKMRDTSRPYGVGEALDLWVKKGYTLNSENNWRLLRSACCSANAEALQWLFAQGVDLTQPSPDVNDPEYPYEILKHSWTTIYGSALPRDVTLLFESQKLKNTLTQALPESSTSSVSRRI